VLLFVKYPTLGRVKTRLSDELGDAEAVSIYRNFIVDLLSTLQSLELPYKIFFHPDSAREKLHQWLGTQHSYVPQSGQDLGERMKNAFSYAFRNNIRQAVVIGSDSPDLPAELVTRSFAALETRDAVIGPARDGGYYLIGFSQIGFLPEAFWNINWSSDGVFEQTLNILKEHQKKTHLLPEWYDVDTLEDLKSLLVRNRNTAFRQSKTYAYLTSEKVGRLLHV
jgi:rSAM/selenodomain-associated transferase 1